MQNPNPKDGIEVGDIRRLVLDVLKPHSPSIVEISKRLSALKGVSGVNCTLKEVDQETETIKITIEGDDLDYDMIKSVLEDSGADIHSVDSVSTGKKIVDELETPQDR